MPVQSSLRPGRFQQIAVQPSLVTVTAVCRLARTGLGVTVLASTEEKRPTRPKRTPLATRILLTVMRLMDTKRMF